MLLVALPIASPYRPIFDGIKTGAFTLLLTNEILSEYEEKIGEKTRPEIGDNVARLLMNLPNVKKIEVYYRWNLINRDPDDNKYVDCAVAGNATYVVSDDSDFRILKTIPFPKINLLTSNEFLAMILSQLI